MVKIIELNGEDFLFIQGNVPSLKNAKIKTTRGIFSSKTVQNYLRSLGIQRYSSSKKIVVKYARKDNEFQKCSAYFDKYLVEVPHEVGFHFIRGSKHRFDFNNASQILADLMTAHDFIEDDDMDNFLPYPMKIDGKAYSYDKENPGVLIKILNKNG
jgi:hypothetical protein